MTVTVKLFARARDLAGAASVQLQLPVSATVADLRRSLAQQIPALAPLCGHLLVAIGTSYASETAPLDETSDIACFPPVSGG